MGSWSGSVAGSLPGCTVAATIVAARLRHFRGIPPLPQMLLLPRQNGLLMLPIITTVARLHARSIAIMWFTFMVRPAVRSFFPSPIPFHPAPPHPTPPNTLPFHLIPFFPHLSSPALPPLHPTPSCPCHLFLTYMVNAPGPVHMHLRGAAGDSRALHVRVPLCHAPLEWLYYGRPAHPDCALLCANLFECRLCPTRWPQPARYGSP